MVVDRRVADVLRKARGGSGRSLRGAAMQFGSIANPVLVPTRYLNAHIVDEQPSSEPGEDRPSQDDDCVPESNVIDGDLWQARELARKYPESPTALIRLAYTELDMGNLISAAAAARRTLQLNAVEAPDLVDAAQVFAAVGDVSEAERAMRAALAMSEPSNSSHRAVVVLAAELAVRRGEPEEALELLADNDTAAGLSLKGALLVQKGQYHDAIRALRASLRGIPDDPSALCDIGYAYAAAGSVRKAVRATAAAASLDPADRTAGLNLADLLLSQDRAREAVAVIERLASFHPGDIGLERAAAAALHAAGDTDRAVRRLRKAKTARARTAVAQSTPPGAARRWAAKASQSAALLESEELEFHILLITAQPADSSFVFARAWEALERCDYRSEEIARVLASAARSPADLHALEKARTELGRHHRRAALLAVESRVAFWRLELDRCLDAVIEWLRREPFSAEAHIAASCLLSMHRGDYKTAARVGCQGVGRGVRDEALLNNVAFAHAMNGEPERAARVLPDPSKHEIVLPTAGLVEAARGNPERGAAMYEDCAKRMRARGEHDLADLSEMHRLLAEIISGTTIPEERLAGLAADPRVTTDPRFAMLHHTIKRENSRRR